jgi:hypothetical protein
MVERSAGIGISQKIGEFNQKKDIFDECRLCLAILFSVSESLSI